jgi:ubiquitin C-terminal hydrolase
MLMMHHVVLVLVGLFMSGCRGSASTTIAPVPFVNPNVDVTVEPVPVVSSDMHFGDGVRGFSNMGNTCYFNSILQILVHIPDFRQFFVPIELFDEKMNSMEARLVNETANVFKRQWISPAQLAKTPIMPNRMFSVLREMDPAFFKIGTQQDGHEAIVKVIDHLTLASRIVFPSLVTKDSPIGSFEFQTTIRMNCAPDVESNRTEKAAQLTAYIPATADVVDLDVRPMFYPTTVEEVDCPDGKHAAVRRLSMDSFPKILMVLAHRTSDLGVKNASPVRASETLVLTSIKSGEPVVHKYRLVGIVHHHGAQVTSGHYTAEFRHPDSRLWFNADDSQVTKISTPSLVSKTGLLYFYEQI